VDYSLVSGPTFGPNYLTINSKGEFYYLPHKTVHFHHHLFDF
jgi:hypothetical protein